MNGKSESREGNGMIINKSIRLVENFPFSRSKFSPVFLSFLFFFFFRSATNGKGEGRRKTSLFSRTGWNNDRSSTRLYL